MTATNHVTTGALIGTVVANPFLALSLAFASHFALDSLPHWDHPGPKNSRSFILALSMDCGLAAGVLLAILVLAPPSQALLIAACGVAGASPDLMWFSHWLRELQGKPKKPLNLIERFHARIQKYAKYSVYTFAFEALWFVVAISLLTITIG